MDVSIVIVTYNTLNMTCECIDSIYKHTKDCSFEVILIDNASSDGSKDVFKIDKRVYYIYSDVNLGFGKANNKGLKIAKGKYIFYLNSDTVILNNAVKMFFDYWENAKNKDCIGALGGILLDDKLNPIHSSSYFPTYTKLIKRQINSLFFHFIKSLICIFRLSKLYIKMQKSYNPIIKPYFGDVDYITGADLFLKNDENAYFDENFFLYYEETDLEFSLKKIGKKRIIIDGPRIIHLTRKISEKFSITNFSTVNEQISAIKYAKKI